MELIGHRFGHIRVTDVVGQGGMGDVYGGYDEKLERRVALKALAPEQRLDTEARERLLREARALSKLDHPNICRIHDYIESDEADLLILEFIDGKTLGDLMNTPMARAEKLRICGAVASVLVVAHRAGIVHRDLKPENVMLTRSGEVKVLDFGLARWLQRPLVQASPQQMAAAEIVQASPADVTASLPRGGLESGPLETAAGIAMGTPLYMSPEQARGEVLTPASDMFSFGLLMQALFTGSDPHPAELSGREVILRVARGETNAVAGVQGDVAALINRLKQFAAADRPTALEAVERLQFMSEKPRRIARRTAAAAVAALLAFGGWRYTVDLQTERAKALVAQADAEKRRAQAEDLIEFMMGDLRTKLGEVKRLDILDDIGQRALTYASSLDVQTVDAEELARNSKALNQLGEVRVDQGKVQEALNTFRKSLNLATVAVRKAPEDPAVQLAYGTAHFWVGNAERLRGNLPRALEHMRMYQRVGEKLASMDPERDEYQLERAYGHDVVGTILEASGQYAQARDEYLQTLAIQEARLRRDPASPERRHDVAFARNKLGSVLRKLGDTAAAMLHLRAEYEGYRELHARDPKNTRWKDRLANSLSYLAAAEAEQGQTSAAMRHRLEGQQLWRELVAHDPNNVQWQRNLATTHMQVGVLHRQQGDLAAADDALGAARKILEPLASSDPQRTTWQVDLAVIDTELGRVDLSRDRDAVARARSAVTRLRKLVATDAKARSYLAAALLLLGEAEARQGGHDEAERAWTEVLDLAGPVASQSLTSADHRIRALIFLGREAEARADAVILRRRGYRNPDLERLCAARGIS